MVLDPEPSMEAEPSDGCVHHTCHWGERGFCEAVGCVVSVATVADAGREPNSKIHMYHKALCVLTTPG